MSEIIRLDAEQKSKIPETTIGDSQVGVWKNVLQDVLQDNENVLQDVPQDDENVLQEIDSAILELIKKDNKISRKIIGSKLNISEKTVGRYLKGMTDKVIFKGSGYSGHWELLK